MARYLGDDNGRRIEVVTHWNTKCELLVDGKQVDSGALPLLGGTLKLADTWDNGEWDVRQRPSSQGCRGHWRRGATSLPRETLTGILRWFEWPTCAMFGADRREQYRP